MAGRQTHQTVGFAPKLVSGLAPMARSDSDGLKDVGKIGYCAVERTLPSCKRVCSLMPLSTALTRSISFPASSVVIE